MLNAISVTVEPASVSPDPTRCCDAGHQLQWLSIAGACELCGQQFVALMNENIDCFKCGGTASVKRTKCSPTEFRF